MTLQLRSPEDVKRLFSAVYDVSGAMSDLTLADVDALALQNQDEGLSAVDTNSLALSLLIALATGWVAIRGYERNGSLGWGLAWGVFGYLLPVPAVAISAYRDVH
jgi:hypothetical protein